MGYLEFLWHLLVILLVGGLIYGSVGCLIHIKKKWWTRLSMYFGCWLIASMVLFIGDLDNLPPTLAAFLVIVWIACEGSTLKKLTIGLMIASTVFACNTLVDNFLWNLGEPFFLYGRAFFAVALFFITKFLSPDKDYELSSGMWKLLLLLTATPIGIVLSVVLLSDIGHIRYHSEEKYLVVLNYRASASTVMYVILLLLALFSFLGLLWTVSVLAKHRKLEQQSMFAEINQKYYEAMEQQHFEIRRLKHDLANHLQTLAALPDRQKDVYLKELLQNSPVTQTLNYCGDATVNAVLTVKENLMHREGISFQRNIDISQELPLEQADICALFANALDNAIEACRTLALQKREILLESRAQKGLLVISIKNPCMEAAESKEEKCGTLLPKTTKPDRKNHGIGLQSIHEIVNRYQGDMEIRQEEGMFELFLYLSI